MKQIFKYIPQKWVCTKRCGWESYEAYGNFSAVDHVDGTTEINSKNYCPLCGSDIEQIEYEAKMY